MSSESFELAVKFDAEDRVQANIHIKLWALYEEKFGLSTTEALFLAERAISKASENFSSFEGRSSLSTWLFSIARNIGRDYCRSKRRGSNNSSEACDPLDHSQLKSLDNPDILNSASLAVSSYLLPEERRTISVSRRQVVARRTWLSLKKADRRVLYQSTYLRLTDAEIAAQENVCEATVRSRRCRAQQRLNKNYVMILADEERKKSGH